MKYDKDIRLTFFFLLLLWITGRSGIGVLHLGACCATFAKWLLKFGCCRKFLSPCKKNLVDCTVFVVHGVGSSIIKDLGYRLNCAYNFLMTVSLILLRILGF